MRQKSTYPYGYIDSLDRLNEERLPKKEDFYSVLNDEHISQEQYDHVKKV